MMFEHDNGLSLCAFSSNFCVLGAVKTGDFHSNTFSCQSWIRRWIPLNSFQFSNARIRLIKQLE